MFVLEVTTGPTKGKAIELVRGKKLTVGRSTSAQVHLDDGEVSGRHAEVAWTDEGFSVTDLGSKNGTFVNGKGIQGTTGLRLGDFIQVGGVILRLKEVAGEAVPAEGSAPAEDGMLAFNATKTVVMHRMTAPRALPKAEGKPPVKPPAPIPATSAAEKILSLGKSAQKTAMSAMPVSAIIDEEGMRAAADLAKVVNGPAAENAKVIAHRDPVLDPFSALPVSIGRETANSIVLDDNTASLRHAVIDFRDNHFVIRDVGSSNGTYVNGQRIVMKRLDNGDIITIGAHTMLVVLGKTCLGLEIRAPDIQGGPAPEQSGRLSSPDQQAPSYLGAAPIGVVTTPLGDQKKRKKKASELVWFATSDLDKGVFRARSAMVALAMGLVGTMWMLGQGGSEVLAGGRLMDVHEGDAFDQRASELGRNRCTACHVGVGRVSSIKCVDCHPYSRPAEGHVVAEMTCYSCHKEHAGPAYRSSHGAALACTGCHPEPHGALLRRNPVLVRAFRPDAPATEEWHMLHHVGNRIACVTCHGEQAMASKKKERSACGQCHAPDGVVATECHQCHKEHPDRDVAVEPAPVRMEAPPVFQPRSIAWILGLVISPFVIAALIPRKRKVDIADGAAKDKGEHREKTQAK